MPGMHAIPSHHRGNHGRQRVALLQFYRRTAWTSQTHCTSSRGDNYMTGCACSDCTNLWHIALHGGCQHHAKSPRHTHSINLSIQHSALDTVSRSCAALSCMSLSVTHWPSCFAQRSCLKHYIVAFCQCCGLSGMNLSTMGMQNACHGVACRPSSAQVAAMCIALLSILRSWAVCARHAQSCCRLAVEGYAAPAS